MLIALMVVAGLLVGWNVGLTVKTYRNSAAAFRLDLLAHIDQHLAKMKLQAASKDDIEYLHTALDHVEERLGVHLEKWKSLNGRVSQMKSSVAPGRKKRVLGVEEAFGVTDGQD